MATENKILSLYDNDARVIVRGKAGHEVEFGQGLLLTEQVNGLIIDWELFAEQPPSNQPVLIEVLVIKRMMSFWKKIIFAMLCAQKARRNCKKN